MDELDRDMSAVPETTELLRKLYENSEQQKKYMKAQATAAKLQSAAVAAFIIVLVAALAAVAFIVTPRVQATLAKVDTCLDEMERVTATLTAIDFIGLSESIKTLAVNGNESLTAAMGELQTALSGVGSAIATVEGIDIDGLNVSIKSLSGILEPLAKFFGVR